MRQAKDFLPFIECALEVFGSKTEEPLEELPPDAERGVRFEYGAINVFLGRPMDQEEMQLVGSILCESMDEKAECGVWQLAHMLQHFSEEHDGATH